MDTFDQPAVAGYYAAAGSTLARQLAGRRIHAGGWSAGQRALPQAPGTGAEITAEAGGGARWFAWEVADSTPSSVQVSAGNGADIATAATAALALIEAITVAGGTAVPATDGQGGLLVFVNGIDDLADMATTLAGRAPEIATVDAAGTDGRAWLAISPAGSLVPAPYSLVDSVDGTGVVLPLTVDELAAVTAGMPLDPRPDEVADRLVVHGDLAASLIAH